MLLQRPLSFSLQPRFDRENIDVIEDFTVAMGLIWTEIICKRVVIFGTVNHESKSSPTQQPGKPSLRQVAIINKFLSRTFKKLG